MTTGCKQLVAGWGGPAGIETFAPSLAGDPQARAWWAGLLRAASSPGAIKGVLEALRDTDVRNLWAEFPFRHWCSTGAATAPFASAPADISPATSRRRDSSSSTAPITGSSPAISNPFWPASSNSSAVSQLDCEREMHAKVRLAANAWEEFRPNARAFLRQSDVRVGSFATETQCPRYVRSSLNFRHNVAA